MLSQHPAQGFTLSRSQFTWLPLPMHFGLLLLFAEETVAQSASPGCSQYRRRAWTLQTLTLGERRGGPATWSVPCASMFES